MMKKLTRYATVVFICFAVTQVSFAQKVQADKTGEVIMTQEELESLLHTIAVKRQEQIDRSKNDRRWIPQASVQPAKSAERAPSFMNDPAVYQELRNLNSKIDLLMAGQGVPKVAAPIAAAVERAVHPSADDEYAIYFSNDSKVLSNSNISALRAFVDRYGDDSAHATVMLHGFASKVGNAQYNNNLSFERADAVKETLIKLGLDPRKIVTLYHGADGTKDASVARRVEIEIFRP